MNCKPGDLAVVFGGTPFDGMIVDVLYSAPTEPFILPNGQPHVAASLDSWVVKVRGKVPAFLSNKLLPKMTDYGVGWDGNLKPIRDNGGEDETITWAGKPQNLELTT